MFANLLRLKPLQELSTQIFSKQFQHPTRTLNLINKTIKSSLSI
ncbi:hypothetical protein [Acinetobacter phage Ab69]|nr:hypothetical protein [Acinetobacter phage Ab69]